MIELNVPKIRVTIVALDGVMGYTLSGPYDVLSSIGNCWESVSGEKPQTCFEVQIAGLEKGLVRSFNQFRLECHKTFHDVDGADLILIPSIGLNQQGTLDIPESFYHWLRMQHASGVMVASICTGTFVLAEAGLLQHRIATTHWAYESLFRQRYPDVRLHIEEMLTSDERVVCAGGSASWQYLTSYLLNRLAGAEIARQANRYFLLSGNLDVQTPSRPLPAPLSYDDTIIRNTQKWMRERVTEKCLVQRAADYSGLTERTFKRRFKAATGQSPLEYLQNVRIEKAKRLLEFRNYNLLDVAEQVGYSEDSYFRRLFKRKVGITAHEYQRAFSVPVPHLSRKKTTH